MNNFQRNFNYLSFILIGVSIIRLLMDKYSIWDLLNMINNFSFMPWKYKCQLLFTFIYAWTNWHITPIPIVIFCFAPWFMITCKAQIEFCRFVFISRFCPLHTFGTAGSDRFNSRIRFSFFIAISETIYQLIHWFSNCEYFNQYRINFI